MNQDRPTPQDAKPNIDQAPEAPKQEAAQEADQTVEVRKQKAAQAVKARRQQAIEARKKAVREADQAPETNEPKANQEPNPVPRGPKPKAASRRAETPKSPEPQKSQQPQASDSPVTKAAQTATRILTSVFNTVKKPVVGSKVYTNNKAKLDSGWKRVQPLVKVVQWLWKKILKPFWIKVVQPLWAKVLGLLRPRLPEPLKQLSDRILTAIVIGPLVLVWWLISSLTSAAPVAQPPTAQPVVSAPKSAPAQPQKPALEAPVAPEIVEEPAPPVPAEPEEPQKVVLSVQQQVAQISDRYSTDLIPQVQADFAADRLVVQVSSQWYDLSSTEQDDLGLDVLERSVGLDFKTLEIRDVQGQLVARNPVVGPHIIVLQRHQI